MPLQLPHALAHVMMGKTVVPGQRIGTGRRAPLGQVRRRRAQHRPARCQPSRDQARVDRARNPHRHVHPLLHQVHHPVHQQQLHPRQRVPPHELGHRRRQVQLPERHTGRHPQQPMRLRVVAGHLALQLIANGQHLPEAQQRRLPRPGQADPPRGPVQQPRPQPRFHLRQVPRHHRPRHVQRLRRRSQAAALGHLHEHMHRSKTVHLIDPRNKLGRYTRFFVRFQRHMLAFLPQRNPPHEDRPRRCHRQHRP